MADQKFFAYNLLFQIKNLLYFVLHNPYSVFARIGIAHTSSPTDRTVASQASASEADKCPCSEMIADADHRALKLN